MRIQLLPILSFWGLLVPSVLGKPPIEALIQRDESPLREQGESVQDCEDGCPQQGPPVCGSDGQTYCNRCVATCNGIDAIKNGHCPPTHAIGAKGFPRDGEADGMPAKLGKMDISGLDKDLRKVKVLKFQGMKGKKTINFDRKKVRGTPTNPDFEEDEDKFDKENARSLGRKERHLPQAWFGQQQGNGNKKDIGFGTINIMSDSYGNVVGSVLDDEGNIYNFNTAEGEDGEATVVMIRSEDMQDEVHDDSVEQNYHRDRRLSRTSANLRASVKSLSNPGSPSLVRDLQKCSDRPGWFGEWYDSDGPTYDCDWYSASSSRCDFFGDDYSNFGYTANEACCACGGGGAGVVDIMVVYTKKAMEAEASLAGSSSTDAKPIKRRIALAVQEANVAYELSGISTRLRLVHTQYDSTYDEQGKSYLTMLSQLKTSGDGQLEYESTRNTYGADLVALIVEGGSYCGIGYRPGAYTVTKRTCATGYFSFAHEVGHNLGAHHDFKTSGGSSAASNHGYVDPDNLFRSIMAYNVCGGCPRVQRFSNTKFTYNNWKPIGNSTANNAAQIESYTPTAALLKSSQSCNVMRPEWVGDGYCDTYGEYNTARCGWDGGDCCEETCVDGPNFFCDLHTQNNLYCLDPKVDSGTQLASCYNRECVDMSTAPDHDVNIRDCNDCNGQMDCSDQRNQKWYYHKETEQIKNVYNDECLTAHTGDLHIFVQPCHTGSNQKWYQDGDRIKSHWNHQCMDMHKGHGNVELKSCNLNSDLCFDSMDRFFD